jgi:hypothetical protein
MGITKANKAEFSSVIQQILNGASSSILLENSFITPLTLEISSNSSNSATPSTSTTPLTSVTPSTSEISSTSVTPLKKKKSKKKEKQVESGVIENEDINEDNNEIDEEIITKKIRKGKKRSDEEKKIIANLLGYKNWRLVPDYN